MKVAVSRPSTPDSKLLVKVVSHEVDRIGGSRPVVFILPGGPGISHLAYMKYACLLEVADLVFHDPRGCDESDQSDASSYTMTNYIEDVDAIRQHLSLDKIIVIGKSYGSMCALGYTIHYPQRTEKLVLSSGAPSYHFLETAKQTIKRIGTPEQQKICEKIWKGDFKSRQELVEYFKLTHTLYSVKGRTQPEAFDLDKRGTFFSYEVLNEGFRQSFWHFDYRKDLVNISCPTLVLAGREDWINDVKYAEEMANGIPHSQLVIFDKASHATESDVEEEYFQKIADFIS